jgi:hypothetical protein
MIDLDHLEALDDDAPPEPDLAFVRRRVSRIRTRNRVTALGTGAAVLVVVLLVAALYPRGTTDHTLVTTQPNRSSGVLPNGLHAELTLDTPAVALGNNIRATLVVRNDTGETVQLARDSILDCVLGIAPDVLDSQGQVDNALSGPHSVFCRPPSEYDDLAPGATKTFPITVFTSRLDIDRAETYRLTVGNGGGWSLPAIPVRIKVPPLGIHIETRDTIGLPGDVIDGTVLFTNRTNKVIEYPVGCGGRKPWKVSLMIEGKSLAPAQTTPGCYPVGWFQRLQPGETRIPFSVALRYPECSLEGDITVRSPRCVGTPPGVPPLPPGNYEIAFEAQGTTFADVDVDPVAIRVVPST